MTCCISCHPQSACRPLKKPLASNNNQVTEPWLVCVNAACGKRQYLQCAFEFASGMKSPIMSPRKCFEITNGTILSHPCAVMLPKITSLLSVLHVHSTLEVSIQPPACITSNVMAEVDDCHLQEDPTCNHHDLLALTLSWVSKNQSNIKWMVMAMP